MEWIEAILGQKHGILIMYILVINVITFLAFAIDKGKAKMGRWRIKEATLLGLSLIGGAACGLLAMWVCHHKVRKPKFYIGVPAMLILQAVLLIWYLK